MLEQTSVIRARRCRRRSRRSPLQLEVVKLRMPLVVVAVASRGPRQLPFVREGSPSSPAHDVQVQRPLGTVSRHVSDRLEREPAPPCREAKRRLVAVRLARLVRRRATCGLVDEAAAGTVGEYVSMWMVSARGIECHDPAASRCPPFGRVWKSESDRVDGMAVVGEVVRGDSPGQVAADHGEDVGQGLPVEMSLSLVRRGPWCPAPPDAAFPEVRGDDGAADWDEC